MKYEAVIIGSGFGGAVLACRLSKKWPEGKVAVVERGKRYLRGSFPRSPQEMAGNFWSIEDERIERPRMFQNRESRGLFDVSSHHKMDVVRAAGLGGGSLIYANVFMEMPEEELDYEGKWPASLKRKHLNKYYEVARDVMGVCKMPQFEGGRKDTRRSRMYTDVCREMKKDTRQADLCVFFGKNPQDPDDMGRPHINKYGAEQFSCTYCSECDLGCNTHSKNTLDLNYLHVAENYYGAEIFTETLAVRIATLDENGAVSRKGKETNGQFGYRVYCRDLTKESSGTGIRLDTKRVVLSGGTLGTTEMLLRCRDQYQTLPDLNENVGKHFSGNGDFQYMSFGCRYQDADKMRNDTDLNRGPVITTVTDFGLTNRANSENGQRFILEDAAVPPLFSWMFEALSPRRMVKLAPIFGRIVSRKNSYGNVSDWNAIFQELVEANLASGMIIYLFIGIDSSDGAIYLKGKGDWTLSINWPQKTSSRLYEQFQKKAEEFKRILDGSLTLPMPTWFEPNHKNITVHPLGGCRLADSESEGVISANPDEFGQVFGYQNLYVADGSMIPGAIGSNPAATILALSEMVAKGITGITPTAELLPHDGNSFR